MNPETHDDIQIAMMPAPMDGAPSEELVRRLRVLASETPRRAPWWRSPFIASATVAGGVATLVAMASMPTTASAKSFDLIVAAAQRIDAFQFSIRTDEGVKAEAFTIAGSGGHVYMKAGEDGAMQIDPGSLSIYSAEENKIVRFKFGGLVDPETVAGEMRSRLAQGLKEMDLKKMLREYQAKYGREGISISPVTREEGHTVYHVTLASRNEPERVEMTVDATTDLPERLQVESEDGSHRRLTLVTMEMRFGSRVDPNLLRSSLPEGLKVEEIDLGSMVQGAMKSIQGLGDAFEKSGAKPAK